MTVRARALSSLAAIALIVATGARAADSAVSQPLGQDLAGESCRMGAATGAFHGFDILCGDSTDAVGKVQASALGALPQEATARRAAIVHNAKSAVGVDQVRCDDGQWFGTGDNVLLVCTLRANSWPRIAVASASGSSLYVAQGTPAMLPVLNAAIGNSSGRGISPADSQAAQKLLETKLSKEIVHASTSDFNGYRKLVEQGRLYSGADNYAGAENAYRQALDIETRLFGPDSVAVGETLAELALQVSNQGRFEEAAALFHRAQPIIEASSSNAARARFDSYLALDAANQRHFADALKYAREATAERRAEVDANSSPTGGTNLSAPATMEGELAHSLRIEAEMAIRLGDVAAARAAAEEALWIISQEPGLPLWWRPEAVALMGEINEREARVVTAERDFHDAVELDKKLFGDTAPTAMAELRFGKFYSDQQLYPASLAAYREAFAILAKDPVARSQIVPDQIVPFVTAAEASAKDPQQKAALEAELFRASQYANSDVADQTIARASARMAAGNAALSALIRQVEDAQRARDNARVDLAAEYAKADQERNTANESKLAADVKAASARADALMAHVNQDFPDYAKLADPGPAELADVERMLMPGEAFLSFVIGMKGSYALLVTQQGLIVRHLDVTTDGLKTDVADLRRAFVPQLGRLPEFSLKSSNTLYHQLLGPLEGDLNGVNQLSVAATGDLANLPLALLVTESPREGAEHSYTSAAWLVRRMALSQVPSPRAFVSLRTERQHRVAAAKPFLGVGDPTFTGGGAKALDTLTASCRENGPMPADLLRSLPPLHDTAGEVKTVAAMLGGDSGSLLLGANATETELRAHRLDQYSVLYFATHGLLPGELHCQTQPGLVLSPPAHAASTDSDGLLDASEIATLQLNADLVVLSACNTGAAGGGRFGGSALEGLADAFFNAGARAVLASHWEVPSGSTVKLMTGIFSRGQRSSGVAESLRQSQLALIAQPATAHPFHWAAFTVIGDGATLSKTASEAKPSDHAQADLNGAHL